MKKLVLIFALLISAQSLFAQQAWKNIYVDTMRIFSYGIPNRPFVLTKRDTVYMLVYPDSLVLNNVHGDTGRMFSIIPKGTRGQFGPWDWNPLPHSSWLTPKSGTDTLSFRYLYNESAYDFQYKDSTITAPTILTFFHNTKHANTTINGGIGFRLAFATKDRGGAERTFAFMDLIQTDAKGGGGAQGSIGFGTRGVTNAVYITNPATVGIGGINTKLSTLTVQAAAAGILDAGGITANNSTNINTGSHDGAFLGPNVNTLVNTAQVGNYLGKGDWISLSSAPTVFAVVKDIVNDTSLVLETPLGDGTSQSLSALKRGIARFDNVNGVTEVFLNPIGNLGLGTLFAKHKFTIAGGDTNLGFNIVDTLYNLDRLTQLQATDTSSVSIKINANGAPSFSAKNRTGAEIWGADSAGKLTGDAVNLTNVLPKKSSLVDSLNGGSPAISNLTTQFRFSNTANDFFADTAKATQLITLGNITIPTPTATTGIIQFSNSVRFVHGYPSQENAFLGYAAGNLTMTGLYNTGVGYRALFAVTDGTENTAIGHDALKANTTGDANNAFGAYTLQSNTDGFGNMGFGRAALSANTLGDYNVGIGYRALLKQTDANNNTAVGAESGFENLTGSGNIYLGFYAGHYSLGSNRLFIDNQDRTNAGGDSTKAIIYGVMGATAANQSLRFNVANVYTANIVLDSAAYADAFIDEDLGYDSIMVAATDAWYTIGAVQTPNGYKLTAGDTVKNITVQDSSMTVGVNGVYNISYAGNGRTTGMAAASNLHTHIFVNDVLRAHTGSDGNVSASNAFFSLGISPVKLVLKKNDIVKVKVQSPDDGSGVIIFHHFNVGLTRIEQ